MKITNACKLWVIEYSIILFNTYNEKDYCNKHVSSARLRKCHYMIQISLAKLARVQDKSRNTQ